ncbi:hypothetical protein ACU5JM_00565 (plasmid) [Rhodococcus erythropolis]
MKRKALLLITGALVIAFVNRSLGSAATTQPFGVPLGHRLVR